MRGNSCVLKEAATASYSWKINVNQILLTEIVGKLKYTNGLHPETKLKSEPFLEICCIYRFFRGCFWSCLDNWWNRIDAGLNLTNITDLIEYDVLKIIQTFFFSKS